jgi:hypothetical protein
MKPEPGKVQAAIDPVIAGMDRLGRGEDWPKADARAARAATAAAEAACATEAAEAACATEAGARAAWAADAAWAATFADVPRARQRDILLRLIQEASA